MSVRLGADLGLTSFSVRYNSGRHISHNGRRLAALLTELVAAYPLPIDELVLIGHSMGGLVARSAAHYGQVHGALWVPLLKRIVCLGTPHQGAPLEQVVNGLASLLAVVPTPGTLAPAAVLNSRSAGLKDLRFGYTVDEEWQGRAPDAFRQNQRRTLPPVAGVDYIFVGASVARDPDRLIGRTLGDYFVPPSSATRPGHLASHRGRAHILGNLHHLRLLNHPDVYAILRHALE
jgi:pimeloyl-ACP methyl ester carboxylesterase